MAQGILLVLIAINLYHDVVTSQGPLAVVDSLVLVGALCMLAFVWRRERHQAR